MPTVRANGLDIAYDVHGAGPPLVLLHGATSAGREDFAAQIPLLSKAFRVYVPDARGHAGTRWDAAQGFRYDWLVNDLAALADALAVQTFHAIGFSMGAMTALQFAVRSPGRLRTLVVIGITSHREPRASVAQRLMDPQRALQRDPRWVAELARRHDPVQGEGAWQRLLPAIAADVAVQPLLGPAELHSIDCPTMVVCGDRDPFVPVEHAAGIARQVLDGRLFVVPDCGHEVMVRRPGLFNEAIAGFYRSTEPVARARAEGLPPPAAVAVARVPTAEVELGHPEGADVPAIGQTDVGWLRTEFTEGDRS